MEESCNQERGEGWKYLGTRRKYEYFVVYSEGCVLRGLVAIVSCIDFFDVASVEWNIRAEPAGQFIVFHFMWKAFRVLPRMGTLASLRLTLLGVEQFNLLYDTGHGVLMVFTPVDLLLRLLFTNASVTKGGAHHNMPSPHACVGTVAPRFTTLVVGGFDNLGACMPSPM